MFRSYDDIQDVLGEPMWFDGNGVPRYCAFHPNRCGVYDNYVAFVRIGCQGCDREFQVASEWGLNEVMETAIQNPIDPMEPAFPDPQSIGSFHYGDPPAHGCSGDSMNSIPRQVLQFWRRPLKQARETWEWTRDPALELTLEDDA